VVFFRQVSLLILYIQLDRNNEAIDMQIKSQAMGLEINCENMLKGWKKMENLVDTQIF
jgi:hypothetical protein